ncbi:MAG: hypothetical protein JWQ97_2479 [Phenylobacterium sp.]|nr:hypothetical protein [Phenylobacterium sp.]
MRVLIIGAGGFLGSAVARRLAAAGCQVLALARDPAKAETFNARGLQPVLGDFGSESLLQAVDAAEAVINCASYPFDQEWNAVARLIQRMNGTGKPFIQTTGTAVLSIETPDGEWREETFGEDDAFSPPPWIAVRTVTEAKVREAAATGIRSMVVRPPMIWGHGGSLQIPAMLNSLRTAGAPCYIGQGLNLYSHVHVDDLAEVYRLALERGAAGALYHAVAGETSWRSIAQAIGRVAGRAPRSVSLDEARQIWGEFRGPLFFGVSSRSQAPRTRAELGWRPVHLDVLDDVENGSYRAAAAFA